jgi:iron(III) transport system substrate-binding protein
MMQAITRTNRTGRWARTLRHLAFVVGVLASACSAAASTPATLTVYAAMGYDDAVVRAFTRATGVAVKLVHLSTGPLLARVQAERVNPQWDVLWFDGDEAMQGLATQGLLQCGWQPAVRYTPLGQRLVPSSHCWLPVGVTYAGVILYNPKTLTQADWPHDWNDLVKPALRGKVGMNDPAVSGPTYPFVAGILQQMGQTAGEAFFSRLKANGLKVFPTNSVTLRALQYGQIDAAIVQSSAALGFMHEMPGLRVAVPQPATVLPSDLAIGRHASGALQAQAQRFVQWVLSPAGQAAMQRGDPNADSNCLPLLAGVVPRPELNALGAVRTQVLDPAVWGPREPNIVRWFSAHIAH